MFSDFIVTYNAAQSRDTNNMAQANNNMGQRTSIFNFVGTAKLSPAISSPSPANTAATVMAPLASPTSAIPTTKLGSN